MLLATLIDHLDADLFIKRLVGGADPFGVQSATTSTCDSNSSVKVPFTGMPAWRMSETFSDTDAYTSIR